MELVQAESAQDEQHDDDQTHEVDDAIHLFTSSRKSTAGLFAFELTEGLTPVAHGRSTGRRNFLCEFGTA
jgi:hypothetical protein